VDLSSWQWIALLGGGLLNGMHKTGLNGLSMIAIPAMAAAFGAKLSAGIVLPMLIVGDIIAVFYYRQHAQFKVVLHSLPWVLCSASGLVFWLVTPCRTRHSVG
jgi:H+/Cl- antiporter ClcA